MTNLLQFQRNSAVHTQTDNVMDKWIIASLQSLIAGMHSAMKAYKLYLAVPHMVTFIDSLSKWFVRFNKDTMKGVDNTHDDADDAAAAAGAAAAAKAQLHSLQTLYEVLFALCRLMSPLTPFIVEHMYQVRKRLSFDIRVIVECCVVLLTR
jgi:isoleucyl-tRNA synthetase